MSAQDPGAADGTGVYIDPPPCACGHAWAVHDIGQRNRRKARTECSRSGCTCRTYTPKETR